MRAVCAQGVCTVMYPISVFARRCLHTQTETRHTQTDTHIRAHNICKCALGTHRTRSNHATADAPPLGRSADAFKWMYSTTNNTHQHQHHRHRHRCHRCAVTTRLRWSISGFVTCGIYQMNTHTERRIYGTVYDVICVLVERSAGARYSLWHSGIG